MRSPLASVNLDSLDSAPALPPVAVVAGAASPTGLGCGRALRRAGAEVWGLTTHLGAAPLASRDWKRLVVMPEEEDAWLARLNRTAAEIGRAAFLVPSSDLLVTLISQHRLDIDARLHIALPDDETVQTFLQKTRFYDWARARGLPLPESAVAHSESELRFALRNLPYPLIIKPTYRTRSWNRENPSRKVIKLRSPEDFANVHLDFFACAPSYLVSQWIDGPDSAVHFCLAYCARPGEIAASFTGRKLLQYPRQTGSTAICVDTDNGEITELTREAFRLAGYLGLGSLEVKYDAGGKAFITEPTVGRPNLQSFAAVACGCNLHAIAMADALHLPGCPTPAPRRKCWWVEESNVGELVSSGGLAAFPWRLMARELVRTRRPSFSHWQWRDPAPAARLAAQFARRALNRIRHRLARPFTRTR